VLAGAPSWGTSRALQPLQERCGGAGSGATGARSIAADAAPGTTPPGSWPGYPTDARTGPRPSAEHRRRGGPSALSEPESPQGSDGRLRPDVFRLPVERIRDGYYTDAYFNSTRTLLLERGERPRVLMQVFQKREAALLGGIDEALAVLRLCAGRRRPDGTWHAGWPELDVRALREGDQIGSREVVLTIEGEYDLFAHLETVYLGCLTRRTGIMSNVRRTVQAAGGKPIFYFPARHEHWLVQTGDGWAAHVAGAIGVSTDAQASWWGGRGIGTVPHALIAAFHGDTVRAAALFAERFHEEMNVTVLVDFANDSVGTALAVARELGPRLWGVRLDTAENLVDRSLAAEAGGGDDAALAGVSPELVRLVRRRLDEEGHGEVRIVASGGFDAERIERYEREGVPVDAYGVGASLLRGGYDFTADVVEVDGRPCAKVGRERWPAERLEPVQ
jgi:nicotinate phosphoribosyltransferase